MNFNKANLTAILAEMNEAMETIADRHKIEISIGTMSFDNDSFTCRVKGITENNGNVEWVRYAVPKYGFKPTDFGARVELPDGRVFNITGVRPKARKYPIIMTEEGTDKKLAFAEITVKSFIQRV